MNDSTIPRNIRGLPICPACGECRWAEYRVGGIIQPLFDNDESRFEWDIAQPALDDPGEGFEIFCRTCGERASQEIEDAVREKIS